MAFNSMYMFRCNLKTVAAFKDWCSKRDKDHQVLMRDLMRAVVEGRVKITPTEAQKKAGEIYD